MLGRASYSSGTQCWQGMSSLQGYKHSQELAGLGAAQMKGLERKKQGVGYKVIQQSTELPVDREARARGQFCLRTCLGHKLFDEDRPTMVGRV